MSIGDKGLKLFCILLLFELFSGGSGQIYKLGGIPLRQLIFAISFLIPLIVLNNKFSFTVDGAFVSVTILLCWMIFSTLLGVINGHELLIVANDIKPMSYFLIFYPVAYLIKGKIITYQLIKSILKYSAFTVSISVIAVYFILNFLYSGNGYQLNLVFNSFTGDDIFWFRPGGWVFYPGLFYVLVANLVIIGDFLEGNKSSFFELFTLILGTLAIALSMTKGLFIAYFIGVFAIFVVNKISMKNLAIMLLILIPVIYYMSNTLDFSRALNLSTDTGVKSRITVLDESIQVINNSPIIGNGFGTELPSKKQHQENSFLDIFVEQGLIGLFCYLLVFYFCLVNLKNYTALKIALISIAFMSMTNPYINNPIGIGFIILVLTLNSSHMNSSQGKKNDCGNICNV